MHVIMVILAEQVIQETLEEAAAVVAVVPKIGMLPLCIQEIQVMQDNQVQVEDQEVLEDQLLDLI